MRSKASPNLGMLVVLIEDVERIGDAKGPLYRPDQFKSSLEIVLGTEVGPGSASYEKDVSYPFGSTYTV